MFHTRSRINHNNNRSQCVNLLFPSSFIYTDQVYYVLLQTGLLHLSSKDYVQRDIEYWYS